MTSVDYHSDMTQSTDSSDYKVEKVVFTHSSATSGGLLSLISHYHYCIYLCQITHEVLNQGSTVAVMNQLLKKCKRSVKRLVIRSKAARMGGFGGVI